MARARVTAQATLVALHAVAMAATAAAAGAGRTLISFISVIPCMHHNWSQQKSNDLTVRAIAPCVIPNCSFSRACFILTTPKPPRGIPLTDPCIAVNCGQGGDCEKGVGFSYQCRCRPGFRNLLGDPSMPCIGRSCKFGADCAKLGLINTPAAPADPAPIGNGLY